MAKLVELLRGLAHPTYSRKSFSPGRYSPDLLTLGIWWGASADLFSFRIFGGHGSGFRHCRWEGPERAGGGAAPPESGRAGRALADQPADAGALAPRRHRPGLAAAQRAGDLPHGGGAGVRVRAPAASSAVTGGGGTQGHPRHRTRTTSRRPAAARSALARSPSARPRSGCSTTAMPRCRSCRGPSSPQ